jgi:hypothetical protein
MSDSSEILQPKGYYESTIDWIKNSNNEHLLYSIYPEIPIPKVKKKKNYNCW